MTKHTMLGSANLLLCILFIFVLVTSTYSVKPFFSLQSFLQAYTPNGVVLFSLVVNALLAYTLFSKKPHSLPYRLAVILTLLPLYWFMLIAVGYFQATNRIVHVLLIIAVGLLFYFIRKSSQKIAVALALITLVISVAAIFSGFEEDYCWGKGMRLDPTGTKMVVASKTDAISLKQYDVKEGAQISENFRVHMLCHTSFNFASAIKDVYSLR